jgi:DNA-binding transcriptional MocR family regulator
LSKAYGLAVSPESLFISSGISQALDMICASFTKPGDSIFVEEPSYFLALHIFRDYGLKIVPVPIDKNGLDVELVEDLLKLHKPSFVYTITAHQNPSGVTLSQARKEKLVALAETHDFLILADEVYQLLSYTTHVPKPMAQFVGSQRVFSLGSFSKILAPGLRLGWVQTTPKLIEVLMSRGIIQSGGGLNPFVSAIVKAALDLGLQADYLSFLKHTYLERLNTMARALKPLPVTYDVPQGGYFFWLRLPEGLKAYKLYEVALQQKLNFQVGSKFSSRGELNEFIRLCFSYYAKDDLKEGIARLKTSLEICLNDLN